MASTFFIKLEGTFFSNLEPSFFTNLEGTFFKELEGSFFPKLEGTFFFCIFFLIGKLGTGAQRPGKIKEGRSRLALYSRTAVTRPGAVCFSSGQSDPAKSSGCFSR